MPVEDHEIHESVRHWYPVAGCSNLPRPERGHVVTIRLYDARGDYIGNGTQYIPYQFSKLCRNIGEFINGEWTPMSECRECDPKLRDWEYIHKHQKMHEEELRNLVRIKYSDRL